MSVTTSSDQGCNIKDLPPEVWRDVLGYSKPHEYWFATIVRAGTDGGGVFPDVSDNTQCFEDLNDVSKDIVEGGHLMKALESFSIEEGQSPYDVDLEVVRERPNFNPWRPPSHINYRYLMGEVEKPEDYYTWEGYFKYTVLPLKRMDWLQYFINNLEPDYREAVAIFVYKLKVGKKSDPSYVPGSD
nr:hypothetical protein [Sicyoidochytrium minutum DNA virus]